MREGRYGGVNEEDENAEERVWEKVVGKNEWRRRENKREKWEKGVESNEWGRRWDIREKVGKRRREKWIRRETSFVQREGRETDGIERKNGGISMS